MMAFAPPITRNTQHLSDNHMRTLIALKAAVSLPFIILLQNGFATQFDTLSRSENPTRNLTIFLATWVLALVSVFLASISKFKLARAFWGLALAVALFAYLTFVQIMGHAPTLGDAKTLFIEAGQAQAALLTYWSQLLVPLALSVIFFAAVYFPVPSLSLFRCWWGNAVVIFLPILPILMIAGMLVIKGGAAGLGMPGGPFIAASFTTSITFESLTQEAVERDPVSLVPGQPRIENIIVVVDESISGDFISFDAQTTITPMLQARAGIVADYGIATAAHNCSSYSNATLRWGLTPDNLATARTLPTIWQYAKQSGFTTYYIDSQKQSGTYGNFMELNEAADIDEFVQFSSPQIERDIDYISNDHKAAELARQVIERGGSNFIYINKLGAHFPFEGKYPIGHAKYTPHQSLFQPLSNSSREEVINSYKNAIRWNIDRFFEILLESDALQNTLVIYTADHGQNLFDDDSNTTHCNRASGSPFQGWVPLFAATRNVELLDQLKASASENAAATSHFNIFPTLLLMLGYPLQAVETQYTQTLLSPVNRFGKFAVGNILDSPDATWREVPVDLKPRLR